MKDTIRIGVIGPNQCSPQIGNLAREVGREIAKRGAVLICGGLGGAMEEACRGAKEAGGITVGILSTDSASSANPYVDIPIVTGMGIARNVIVVKSSQAVIAINGRFGTLSEIAFCLQLGIPIVGLKTWDVDPSIVKATDPKDAVNKAFEMIKG